MKLIDFLRKECVIARAELKDKDSTLRTVAETAAKCPLLKNISAQDIFESLKQREQLGTTGFGRGIAIPHCRLKNVSEFVVGLITAPAGVDFEAVDNEKVNLVVFIIAPEEQSNEHIRLLSAISQTLLSPGCVKEVLAAPTDQAALESFLRHTNADISSDEGNEKNLIHVFVQDETVFRDILASLAAADSASIVIVGTENSGAYLSKMPLFAGFWSDEPAGFSRIIIALVDKGLTNETIRRLESITGDLSKRKGVLITVQQIAYSSGSLETRT